MFALLAVIYFAVIGIVSWNQNLSHIWALLFIGLAIFAADFVFTVGVPGIRARGTNRVE